MRVILPLDDVAFGARWEPVFQRVFGSGPCTAWEFWRPERPPPHPGWRFVPMLNHLIHGPSPRHPQHDDGRDPPVFEEASFLATLRSLGRESFCLRYEGRAWLMPPSEGAVEEARTAFEDLIGHYFLFDQQADWGVLCDWDGTISVVGGDDSFIGAYLDHAGGEDALRRRLILFDFGLKWGDAMRPWSAEYRTALYRVFGWEAPPYPNQGEVFDRRPDEDEYCRVWRPILDRLIPQAEMPIPAIPPGWAVLPFRGHVVTEGGGLFEFGVTDPHAKLEEYDALLFVLTSDDRWELCMFGLDEPRTRMSAHVVTPKVWALDVPDLVGRPIAAFGPQGDWVLVSLAEGVSFLAGGAAFISRVLERAGGADKQRLRFEEWSSDAAAREQVMRLAGW